jgi:hypothetical protein|tara:strand:- start:427 stop:1104 length:678 start_codon:yes stop_codon:yes gene_type:complete
MKRLFFLAFLFLVCSCENDKYYEVIVLKKLTFNNTYELDTITKDLDYPNAYQAFIASRSRYLYDSLSLYDKSLGNFKGRDSMLSYSFFDSKGKSAKMILSDINYTKALSEIKSKTDYLVKNMVSTNARLNMSEEERNQLKISNLTVQDFKKKLSGWDGSLESLVDYTKKILKNPDSFEHIETRFIIRKSFVEVEMIYKAQNSFGATVKNSIVAAVSADGDIMRIL